MKKVILVVFCLFMSVALIAEEREETYLKEKLLPAIQTFCQRNELPLNEELDTESVKNHTIEFLTHRPAVMSSVLLINLYGFRFMEETNDAFEIRNFTDTNVKTYHDLSDARPEKIEAVRGLNKKNKLNDTNALALAKKFFSLQGHKEENFHPVEFRQMSWGEKGKHGYLPLPFYEAQWYRKDVTQKDRDSGKATLPYVRIEISGITSNLVSYSKLFMPVGSDFPPTLKKE